MKTLTFFTVSLLLLFLLPSCLAWGPNTHVSITAAAMREVDDCEALQLWRGQHDAFLAGLIVPDVTVIYYYSDFKAYQFTHSWSFAERIWALASTPRERAFAYGVTFHLVQDSVSHNEYVPLKIRETKVLNGIIHPLVEASVEADYISFETSGSLDAASEFVPLIKRATGKDITNELAVFKSIIERGDFYNSGFAAPQDDWKWSLYRGGLDAIKSMLNTDDAVRFVEKAAAESVKYAESRVKPLVDPSGQGSLSMADGEVSWVSYALLFAVSAGLVFIIFVWRRRRR